MRGRRAFSLVEVLVVSAILSASILSVLGLMHFSSRGAVINERMLLARHLASNLAERYRLMPQDRLDALFGDGEGGEAEIDADPVLNVSGVLEADTLRRLGYRRRVAFQRGDGTRPAMLLVTVEWESGRTRRRTVTMGEVVSEMGAPAGRARLSSSSSSPSSPSPSPSSSSPVSSLLATRARAADAADGRLDYPWPEGGVADLAGLGDLLRRRRVPAGTYDYEVERFSSGPGRSSALLTLMGGDGSLFLLVEDFATAGLDDRLTFVAGDPTRPGEARVVAALPPRTGEETAVTPPERRWAWVLVTATRAFVFLPAWDPSGAVLGRGQTVVVADLPSPWKPGDDGAYDRGLAATLARVGLGDETAPGATTVQTLRGRVGL